MYEDERNCAFLFGNEDETGEIVLQDALPVPPATGSLLSLDVITVHHQNYYDRKGAPTDFDSPNPVHFLVVRGEFLFVADAPNRAWRDFVWKLLLDVLATDGLGGKRSSGYGRFRFGPANSA
jgi:CRISPR-associated protein Cmr6